MLSRRDTIVVASVSCIYGVGSPEDYERMLLTVKRGQQISREAVLSRLVDMLYERNDVEFRARKIPGARRCCRSLSREPRMKKRSGWSFSATRWTRITRFDPLTGHAHESLGVITFFRPNNSSRPRIN